MPLLIIFLLLAFLVWILPAPWGLVLGVVCTVIVVVCTVIFAVVVARGRGS